MLHFGDLMVQLDEARGDVFLGEVGETVLDGGAGVGLGSRISVCTIGRHEERTGRVKRGNRNVNNIIKSNGFTKSSLEAVVLTEGAIGDAN